MNRILKITVLLGTLLGTSLAVAGGLALNKRDCEDILRRWAEDPSSVPQALVDACKEVLAAESAVPEMSAAAGPVTDPCADPNAANSIECWGPWQTLAPAAGPAAGPITVPVTDPNLRCEDFDGCARLAEIPNVEAQPPLGSCTPGAPCGFATSTAGLVAQPTDTSDTTVSRFDMADDGSRFTVDPGGSGQLMSVDGMQRVAIGGPARYQGVAGDQASVLEVLQGGPDASGTISQASGLWRNGSTVNQSPANTAAGAFAWGIASTAATLNSLNAGNVTANFSGVMSGQTSTQVNMTVNFGSQPVWSGNWQNPAYGFQAGGVVQGVDLISRSDQFSSNVKSGYVQGALLGEAGSQSVVHAVDVVLDNGGSDLNVRDVGILRQVP